MRNTATVRFSTPATPGLGADIQANDTWNRMDSNWEAVEATRE